jgi:hypothetical protein
MIQCPLFQRHCHEFIPVRTPLFVCDVKISVEDDSLIHPFDEKLHRLELPDLQCQHVVQILLQRCQTRWEIFSLPKIKLRSVSPHRMECNSGPVRLVVNRPFDLLGRPDQLSKVSGLEVQPNQGPCIGGQRASLSMLMRAVAGRSHARMVVWRWIRTLERVKKRQ